MDKCSNCEGRGYIPGILMADGKRGDCLKCVLGLELASERNRENARIPLRFGIQSWATFPVSPETKEVVARLQEWLPGGETEADEGKGLFIHGDYGTGKTGIACQVLYDQLGTGHWTGLFMPLSELLDEIKATYGPDSQKGESEVLRPVKEVNLLVLDDIGSERPTEWVVEKLFAIVNRRYNDLKPTIYTSNLSIGQLADRLGERTTWRIAEMSTVIHLKGPNLRVKK